MNRRLIIRMLGALLLIEAAAMVPSLIVAFVYGEGDAEAIIYSILIILAVGSAIPDSTEMITTWSFSSI